MAPAKLTNNGVSCYLNSTLQCLARMDKFVNHILPKNATGRVAVLRDLLKNLVTTESEYDNTEIQEKFNLLSKGDQEDPHEFLVKLIDTIEEDLGESLMDLYTISTEIITQSNSIKDNTFPLTVNVTFPGAIEELLCDSLWSNSDLTRIVSAPKDFLILYLNRVSYDISSQTLVKANDQVLLTEDLDLSMFELPDENLVKMWKTHCEEVRELSKRKYAITGDRSFNCLLEALDELPASILSSNEDVKEKILDIIKPTMDEKKVIEKQLYGFANSFWKQAFASTKSDVYKLKSFILHIGSANEGHYVAAVKEGADWWVVSDENVSGPHTLETLFKNANNQYLVTLAFYSK